MALSAQSAVRSISPHSRWNMARPIGSTYPWSGDSCRRSVSARSASPSRVSNAARNPTIGLNHGAMAKPRSARLRASSPRPSKARLTPNMKYGKKNASSSSRICRNSSFPSVYLDAAQGTPLVPRESRGLTGLHSGRAYSGQRLPERAQLAEDSKERSSDVPGESRHRESSLAGNAARLPTSRSRTSPRQSPAWHALQAMTDRSPVPAAPPCA